jgi:phage-related minor tail protein
MDKEIDTIAHHIANELNRATQRIEDGKQEVTDYVDALPKNLKQFGKEAAEAIREKFDELSEEVNAKEEELVDMLAEEYVASLNEVNERIEEMKAANRGLIDMAMDFINGVLETIRKLKEAIMGLLSAIASAISVIMADPIGFMGNLFDGIGQGIDLFKTNIQKHLLGGLLEWLTGTMGPMGITIPEDIFSLSGIFSLVMQVLGVGWDMLRMKAVKSMGEPTVNALETGADAGFSIFKTMRSGGIMGLWEFAKEKFSDLKDVCASGVNHHRRHQGRVRLRSKC